MLAAGTSPRLVRSATTIHSDHLRRCCLTLETTGKLRQKVLKQYTGAPKQVDALVCRDVLRHAALHGLLTTEELERWFACRDNRDTAAHDYGEEFAEHTPCDVREAWRAPETSLYLSALLC